jgi:hypothetical protein
VFFTYKKSASYIITKHFGAGTYCKPSACAINGVLIIAKTKPAMKQRTPSGERARSNLIPAKKQMNVMVNRNVINITFSFQQMILLYCLDCEVHHDA